MLYSINTLYRHQHAGVLVPGQQRVLAASRLSVFDVCPAGSGPVKVLDDVKVRREENIKVPLMYLLREVSLVTFSPQYTYRILG